MLRVRVCAIHMGGFGIFGPKYLETRVFLCRFSLTVGGLGDIG